jgi:hypothetical protein
MSIPKRAAAGSSISQLIDPQGTAPCLTFRGGAVRSLLVVTVMTIAIPGTLAGCAAVNSPEGGIPAVSVESLEYYRDEVKGYQKSYPEDHVLVLAPIDRHDLPVSNDPGENGPGAPGGSAEIGVIYDESGGIVQRIYSQPLSPIVQSALANSAQEAGLVPTISDEALESALRRRDQDYVLASQITKCWVGRHPVENPFDGRTITVTDAVFALAVQIYKPPFHVAFWQGSREVDYSDPPPLVSGLPDLANPVSLYDQPGQVLSVALTRAVAGIFVDNDLRGLITEDFHSSRRHSKGL